MISRIRQVFRAYRYPLLIGVVARGAMVVFCPVAPAWDGEIYARAADQLARGEGYTLRILIEQYAPVPTAYYPIGFPALLAALRSLGFANHADLWLQVAIGIGLILASARIAHVLVSPGAGRFCAWIVSLWPGGIVYSVAYLTDCAAGLGIALGLIVLLPGKRPPPTPASDAEVSVHDASNLSPSSTRLIIAGLVFGLTAYLRATPLFVAPFVGAGAGYFTTQGAPRLTRLARATVCTALIVSASLVPLAPWAIRNQFALGSPVLVSTNGGTNMLVGTFGEGGFAHIAPQEDCSDTLTEVARDQCRYRHAKERIRAEPLLWTIRGVLKLWDTLGHESSPAHYLREAWVGDEAFKEPVVLTALACCRAFWFVLISLALVGAWIAATTRGHTLLPLLVCGMLGFGALHFIYLGGDRYHPAVVPLVAVLASLGVSRLRAMRRAEKRHVSEHELTLGAPA